MVAGGDLICSVFCFYNLFLQNKIGKRQEISINEISRHVASFNLWDMEWSRKVRTEDLDSFVISSLSNYDSHMTTLF